jgi:hypothetical protein
MFKFFKVANYIFIGILEGAKELFDEVKGGLMPLARAFRKTMEKIEEEVDGSLKDEPKPKSKPKAKGKRKVA